MNLSPKGIALRSLICFTCVISCGYSFLLPNVTATSTSPAAKSVEYPVGTIEAVNATDEQKNSKNNFQLQANMQTYQRGNDKAKGTRNEADIAALKSLEKQFTEGRGRYKRRKMLKYLQPLLVGVLIVKFILLPLVLKTLAALSTSSFVMSKIALATAGLVVLKWLLTRSGDGGGYDGGAKERTHLEIVHLPLPLTKVYHRGTVGGGGGGGIGVVGSWDDSSLSGSNSILAIKHANKQHKYIPVSGAKQMAHVVAAAVAAESGGGSGGGGYRNIRPYDGVFDGKPFL